MTRILFSGLCCATLFSVLGLAQTDCPPLPDTGVKIGEPVPIVPADVPAGCSAFEILVGQWPPLHTHVGLCSILTLVTSPWHQ
jgi:hypothetical protein